MNRIVWLAALAMSMPPALSAQDRIRTALTFDTPGLPEWSGGPPETQLQDSVVFHSGGAAGRIVRTSASRSTFSSFTLSVPASFSGRTLSLSGWLRLEDVTGFAGLWLREDGPGGTMQFDNMERRQLDGTADWARYRIALPLEGDAINVVFGALMSGEGSLWVDDLALEVDGVPVWEAPPRMIEVDTEFLAGSGIDVPSVTPTQVAKLALLGRVWGFAKYHHPRVVDGDVNWDYELFRVLPAVLDAPDLPSARIAIDAWLSGVGDVPECDPCAVLPNDLQLAPDLGWLRDDALLGNELSERLTTIYERRGSRTSQRYVSLAPGVRNPVFEGEAPYNQWTLPDAGYRLLAAFRLWNIVEYWYPNRDVIGDWDSVLTDFIPRVMGAPDRDAYRLALMEMIARIHDTHANLWGNLDVRPPVGSAALPVVVRFVEGRAVVTGYSNPRLGPESGLRIGDVITAFDGRPVDSLVTAWRPLYAASNEPTRLRDVARTLTRGDPGPVLVTGSRADGPFEIRANRVPLERLDNMAGRTHDLPGETFQRLTDEIAYLKLSSVVAVDVPEYMERAAGAKVLVIDIRNYPGEFVPFALGARLVSEPTPFATFTDGDLSNPGAFSWTPGQPIPPIQPGFDGDVVVLVDEVSQSQAEYTAMAFRAAPRTVVAGSTTAGADGNISQIPLPGGLSTVISGIGVFYPDRTPTQRVGIVPDVEARPTIAGVRAGRDEVLEAGVSHVLGRDVRLELTRAPG